MCDTQKGHAAQARVPARDTSPEPEQDALKSDRPTENQVPPAQGLLFSFESVKVSGDGAWGAASSLDPAR